MKYILILLLSLVATPLMAQKIDTNIAAPVVLINKRPVVIKQPYATHLELRIIGDNLTTCAQTYYAFYSCDTTYADSTMVPTYTLRELVNGNEELKGDQYQGYSIAADKRKYLYDWFAQLYNITYK